MKRFPLWVSLVWVCLGLFVSIYSIRLGLGSLLKPGPGLFPFGLGVLFFALALYKLIKDFQAKASEEQPGDGQAGRSLPLGRLIALAISLFAYALLLESLGYIVATFLAMLALFRIAGYKKWAPIAVYAACVSGITYFGFTYLGTIFPPGILRYLGMH